MKPLWTPSPERAAATELARFMKRAGQRDYAGLHRWSVEESPAFWNLLWEFCEVRGEKGARTLVDGDRMPGAKWFPDARLNYAQNLLNGKGEIVFWGEDRIKRRVTQQNLRNLVSRLAQALADAGVKKGDRVAGYLPNVPEATAALLATASLGAVWSSCSPDFGVQGVLDRFGQIEPKVLLCADGYLYNGKEFDSQEKVSQVLDKLPSRGLLSARLSLHYRSYLVEGYVTNLTKEVYTVGQTGNNEFFGAPREFGLRVRASF